MHSQSWYAHRESTLPLDQQLEAFLNTFHRECADACDALMLARGIDGNAQPAAALNMVTNHAIYTYETVNLFRETWRKFAVAHKALYDRDPALLAQHQEEQSQRLMHATTSLFIRSMSAFEFGLRQFVPRVLRVWDQVDKNKRDRPYLNDFIRAAFATQLIDAEHLAHWRSMITLRNILVHNNGVADKDITVEIPGLWPLSAARGEKTKGNILTFAEYTRFTTWLFAEYVDILLGEAVAAELAPKQ